MVLTDAEQQAVNPAVMMNDSLFTTLNNWVDRYYRDRLTQADLADPQLLREGREALDRLTQLLHLGVRLSIPALTGGRMDNFLAATLSGDIPRKMSESGGIHWLWHEQGIRNWCRRSLVDARW